ncbi:hypothetical protein chiPu_0020311 [Chiloscyllium punctatum]|uniref:Uncharacterized protein n=1 Tax=Chiloscyllium punctatum TaxID=137246 RepID=A0A401REB0_CHIPU|nr:hypothetical protein [Chiloscyllium punctatum]
MTVAAVTGQRWRWWLRFPAGGFSFFFKLFLPVISLCVVASVQTSKKYERDFNSSRGELYAVLDPTWIC